VFPRRKIAIPSPPRAPPALGSGLPCRKIAIPLHGPAIPRRKIAIPRTGIAFPSRGIAISARDLRLPLRKIAIPPHGTAIARRKIAIPRDDLSFLRRGDTIPPRDVRFSRERLLGAREALRATSDTPWVYRDTRGLPPIPLGSTCDTLGFVRWGVAPVRRSLARVSRGVPMQSEGPCRHRGALHLATLGKRVTARFILRERNACASKSDARPSSSHFAAKGQPCIRETGHETARPTRAPRKTQLDRARPSDRSRRCS
jgi:hypothetical protein